ncbi:MAG: HAMP domain-containing histidine kinase [Deltaproteobacteria bacterium]|nr:HAMP domain-containing histidine kinase [Deltaproteobacteria bacterium]
MARRWKYSLWLAGGYFAVAFVTTQVLGHLAFFLAQDKTELVRLQLWVDVGFVVVTTGAVGLAAWWVLRRMERAAAALLELKGALVMAERRAFGGVVAALLAHDSNNALMSAMLDLAGLRPRGAADPEALAAHGRVKESLDRLIAHNRQLLQNARAATADHAQPVDLRALAQECVDALGNHRTLRARQLRVAGDNDVQLDAHPLLLKQMTATLLLHAAEGTPPGGTVELRLAQSADEATLEVHTDGAAASPAERGSTTDALGSVASGDTALALVGARACAEAHGGRLEVNGSPLGGACYRAVLPLRVASRSTPAST